MRHLLETFDTIFDRKIIYGHIRPDMGILSYVRTHMSILNNSFILSKTKLAKIFTFDKISIKNLLKLVVLE